MRFFGLALLFALLTTAGCRHRLDDEVRGLWVVRFTLTSPESVDRMVQTAVENGFNTLMVQVRGRGDAYYRSSLEPRAVGLSNQPADFDPLQRVIDQAKPHGLAVHAWVNTLLVSNLTALPDQPNHIVNRHPEWLMLPASLAASENLPPPSARQFLSRLLDYSKKNRGQLEGLYLDPSREEVREHLAAVSLDLLSKYAVDGIHFDYTRYPNPDFGYSEFALASFSKARGWSPASRQKNVQRAQQNTDSWDQFRRHHVTQTLEHLYRTVKRVHPGVMVTAAVHPEAAVAKERRLQDWPDWLRRRILDGICPMVYVEDTGLFQQELQRVIRLRTGRRVWAGIGAYKVSNDKVAEKIRVARRLRADGFLLFSYTSLVDPQYQKDGKATLGEVGEFLRTDEGLE